MKTAIKTSDAPQAIGPYNQAIRVESTALVFTAGQLGMDPQTNEFVAGGIEEQTRQALKNLDAVLRAAGSELENVIKTTVFLQDMNDFIRMNQVYAEFFPGTPPARSAVQAARLPKDALVEIEAIAFVAKTDTAI